MNGELEPFVYFTKYKYPLKAQAEHFHSIIFQSLK